MPPVHTAGMSYDAFRTLRLVIFGMLMDGPIGRSGPLSACTTAASSSAVACSGSKPAALHVAPSLSLNCKDGAQYPLHACHVTWLQGSPDFTSCIAALGHLHACHACAAGHLWYTFLDSKVMPDNPKSNKAVVLKMMADQFLWAPFFSCVFFAVINVLQASLCIWLLCAQFVVIVQVQC